MEQGLKDAGTVRAAKPDNILSNGTRFRNRGGPYITERKEKTMKKLLCFALCTVLLFSCSSAALAAGTAQTDTVQDILDRSRAVDASCETTVQQQANAAYRLTELLALLAEESTDSAGDRDLIAEIRDSLYSNDEDCETAGHQTVNGLYRSAELLYVLSQMMDSEGDFSGSIREVYEHWQSADDAAETTDEQIVNGL